MRRWVIVRPRPRGCIHLAASSSCASGRIDRVRSARPHAAFHRDRGLPPRLSRRVHHTRDRRTRYRIQCTGSRTSRFSDRFAIGHFRCVRLDGNLACPARRPTKQRGLGSCDVPRSGVRFGNRSAQPHHAHGSGPARPVGTAGLRPACSAQADCTGAPTPGCRASRTERAASVSPSDGIPQDLPARRGGATDTGRPCRRATIPNGSGPAGQAIAPVPAVGNRADSTPIPRRRGCRVSVPSGSSSA